MKQGSAFWQAPTSGLQCCAVWQNPLLLLWNLGGLILNYMVLQLRRLYSSQSLLWEPPIQQHCLFRYTWNCNTLKTRPARHIYKGHSRNQNLVVHHTLLCNKECRPLKPNGGMTGEQWIWTYLEEISSSLTEARGTILIFAWRVWWKP